MTERTESQVNESLDNAWSLIRELQDAQRAQARRIDELDGQVKVARLQRDELRQEQLDLEQRRRNMAEAHYELAQRVEKLESGQAHSRAAAAHDRLDKFSYRLCSLETALQIKQEVYKIEPQTVSHWGEHDPIANRVVRDKLREMVAEGITVTIHSLTDQTMDQVANACERLGAKRILVDAGGLGGALLGYLQQRGLPAEALPKGWR